MSGVKQPLHPGYLLSIFAFFEAWVSGAVGLKAKSFFFKHTSESFLPLQ
jgi:hypothetical protein